MLPDQRLQRRRIPLHRRLLALPDQVPRHRHTEVHAAHVDGRQYCLQAYQLCQEHCQIRISTGANQGLPSPKLHCLVSSPRVGGAAAASFESVLSAICAVGRQSRLTAPKSHCYTPAGVHSAGHMSRYMYAQAVLYMTSCSWRSPTPHRNCCSCSLVVPVRASCQPFYGGEPSWPRQRLPPWAGRRPGSRQRCTATGARGCCRTHASCPRTSWSVRPNPAASAPPRSPGYLRQNWTNSLEQLTFVQHTLCNSNMWSRTLTGGGQGGSDIS